MCDCHCDGTVVGEGGVVVVVFVGIEPVSDGRNYDCIPHLCIAYPAGRRITYICTRPTYLWRSLEKDTRHSFVLLGLSLGRVTPILVLHIYGDARYIDMRLTACLLLQVFLG